MQNISFYQTHLDRVSRSFAMCIPKLEPPFRQWISLSYLLCRALDTVEDAPWTNRNLQNAHYASFAQFAERKPQPQDVKEWIARFPGGISEGEELLLRDACILFEELHGLGEAPRKAIQSGVAMMRLGMQHYSGESLNGVLSLRGLKDVNRYCYFVAGVVGQLASELFLLYRPDFKPSPDFQKNALHFGLFLQKVNILKDQGTDQREGRHFVPDRRELLSSLLANAEGGLRYLMEIPIDEKGYRTFCGWSLFLGAASLPWLEKSHEQGASARIPRSITRDLLDAIESIIQDNDEIRSAFAEYSACIPREPAKATREQSREDLAWFHALTRSRLDGTAMNELGML